MVQPISPMASPRGRLQAISPAHYQPFPLLLPCALWSPVPAHTISLPPPILLPLLTSPRSNLVDAIRPHLPALRGTPHGKRILAKVSVKL